MRALDYLDFNTWINFFHSIDSPRIKIIFGVLYGTGCSEKELVSLKVSEIDFNNRSINFQTRKSYLSSEISNLVQSYIQENKLSSKDFLLKTRQSSKISEKRIQQLVMENSSKILKKKIIPKTIRYTHIAHALIKRIPVFSICEQTGLKSQRVIQIASQLNIEIGSHRYEL
jgi:integrase